MANQVELPKLTQDVAIGAQPTDAAISKLVMFVLLEPGGAAITTNSQGHVQSQIIRR